MAVFQFNINIYFEWWKFKTCFEDNLISVRETWIASAYARHFKPICSIENVKFQWPHAIDYNTPVSRVLVTKEPRLVNTITFPAHPGRPRGSQSVRDKPRNKRFQARAEEVPRTIFYRPVPHGRSRYGLWLVPENFCVFLLNQRVAGQGVESAPPPMLENLRRPVFSRPEVGKFDVFFWMQKWRKVWSKLGKTRRPISFESDH